MAALEHFAPGECRQVRGEPPWSSTPRPVSPAFAVWLCRESDFWKLVRPIFVPFVLVIAIPCNWRFVMSKQSTAQKLAQLEQLANEMGERLYARTKLAVEIMADRQWVRDLFKGGQGEAGDHLTERYFADLAGLATYWDLAEVYQAFPDIDDWKLRGFNVMQLSAEAREKLRPAKEEKPTRGGRHGVTVAQFNEQSQELKTTAYELKLMKERQEPMAEELKRLREENADLRAENKELRAELRELRQQLAGSLAAVA